MAQLKIVNDWWDHYPRFFGRTAGSINFDNLLEELRPLCFR